MNEILKHYSKAEIMRLCGVSHATVYNWINKNNMPVWAIERLGYHVELNKAKG